jgi:menaquinone-specific isochorismate synthase
VVEPESDWWLQQLSPAELTPAELELRIGAQTRGGFMASVQDAVDRIRAGVVNKVVLARDLTAELPTDFDLRPVLAKLSDDYQKCWVYSVAGNFGASPELLIRSAQGEVSARVLAGTAGRGTDPDVDRAIADGLAHSGKNRGEHRLAVESLVRSLEPFCDAVEADAEPFSLQLPDVWHLATDVRGHLSNKVDLLRVLAELHPTAAVAGTPRDRALQLIDELEPFDRGFYAGPVGWISADGSGEFVIALRGAQIEDGRLRAMAGCGIVAESDPKAELQETELKFAAIRSVLDR